jgi:hypothetical protein
MRQMCLKKTALKQKKERIANLLEEANSKDFLEEHLVWSLRERVAKLNHKAGERILSKNRLADYYHSRGTNKTKVKITNAKLEYRMEHYRQLYL